MKTSRRQFLMTVAATGATLTATTHASAQAKLDEKDPAAVALAYTHDTKKVDGKKFPKHDKGQHCGNCALWQSKPTDAFGNCALFPGKQVDLNGWCSAYAKKG